jgi:hypothetical protein
MKTLFFIFSLVVGSLTVAYCQDSTDVQRHDGVEQQQEEVQIVNEKIEPRELPEAVKTTLQSQQYYGWLVNAVYKEPLDKGENPNGIVGVVYAVELISGSRTKNIRFDKDGKELPEKD